MKLSTKGRYGLRAMLDLASYSGEGAVSTSSIAKRQNLSESYLEQLIRKLRNAGLVESVRGKQGGYRLARNPDEISVGEVLRALEGDLLAVNCHDEKDHLCDHAGFCQSRIVWEKINTAIGEAVDDLMLSDLLEQKQQERVGNMHPCDA